ncbi:lipocalin [Desulfonema ishimotonii]|uniref:Outer membrane lipoprotein Blc n=1 Tax=Desulfonema ishimotonii TaxID=45657 RepID=A0A401FV72_9BACT|nr:lipocalin family protein [Desulfonema ishimotonii]GBC60844.1 lipocalin [Desulfonema ishimotonii]
MFEILKKTVPFILLLLSGCVALPENVVPVNGFRIDRYLGRWYEIARLDHSFERGLENVTAMYSYRQDGGIRVINRGFDPEKKEWKEAVGKAYFVGTPDIGRLKVSFFGPFYGGYNIIALDRENYAYALVCGPDKSYLWILAREPHLSEQVKSGLIRMAAALGFETDRLIHVRH